MGNELSYAFGHFQLLPDRRLLLAGGAPLKLGGRAFDMLHALVVRSDRVLLKDELLEIVWPGLVVEENNLQVQIVTLRKLLGHPAIATVPGRGYRFALQVRRDGGGDAPPHEAEPSRQELAPASPRHTNLAPHLPPLFGRIEDVAAVARLLEAHSVVTIAGAGGIGKTRVGQAVAALTAATYADGVWWIELAPLSRDSLVATTVADVLGLDLLPGQDAAKAVASHLRDKRTLLVFDNCEHVLDAVAALTEMIGAAAPSVRQLITSQEVLKVASESVYRLGTLSLPDATSLSMDEVHNSGAGRLFSVRAQAADSHFKVTAGNVAAVAEICRRLDGIPLAIELAAARVPLLGIEGLRANLNQRFNVLTGGARAVLRRHQTLRAALDWSHELLSAEEQAVLRRLGVFSGGFTLESAQRVAHDDTIDPWDVLEHLGVLVDKSLVQAEGNPVPRYRLLETTRLFALEKLAAARETEATLMHHARAMVALIEEIEFASQDRYATQAEKVLLAAEGDNVRAALDWIGREHGADPEMDEVAVELASLAGSVLQFASGAQEAFERTLAVRERVSESTPARTAAQFWLTLAGLGSVQSHAASYDAAARAASLYAVLEDDDMRFRSLSMQIAIGARRGVGEELDEAVAEADKIEPAIPVLRLSFRWARYRWLQARGRLEEALACAQEQAGIAQDAGLLIRAHAVTGDVLADCENALGRYDAAEKHGREALAALERETGTSYYVAHVLDTLAQGLVFQGKHDEAIATARRAVKMTRNEGYHFRLLEPLALNAAHQGRLQDAAWLCGHIDAIYAQRGEVRWPAMAARRAQLDALLDAGLHAADRATARADGATATTDAAFERAFGDTCWLTSR